MTFNVFNAMRYPVESDSCFHLDTMEAIVSNQGIQSDPLEANLIQNNQNGWEDEDV